MDAVKLETHRGFDLPGMYKRRVDVWLPNAYTHEPQRRFPVLYMQDGQNLFKAKPLIGKGWQVPANVEHLAQAGRINPPIVVGITSTLNRMGDYMPEKPMQNAAALAYMDDQFSKMPYRMTRGILSDRYLQWMVEKLKPLIDRTYRTLPGPEHNAVMGSSMGGLISFYAVCEYPEVFGAAACLSTHWPIGGEYFIDWFARHLPAPGKHKFYFDYGDEGLDAPYAAWQEKMDAAAEQAGYTAGVDWLSFSFPGEGHAESYWAGRLHYPLEFLFGIPEGE